MYIGEMKTKRRLRTLINYERRVILRILSNFKRAASYIAEEISVETNLER